MPTRLEALTGLRFLAAFGILLHHFGAALPQLAGCRTFLESLSSSVSFFFVLSGFILVHAYRATERPVVWKTFIVARLARVYPLYLLAALMLAPPLIRWGAAYPDWRPWESFAVLGATVAGVQAWIPRYANLLNPPGWSLSAELFFYALFPLLARHLGGFLFRRPLLSLGVCWAGGIAVGLGIEATIAGQRDILDMGTQFGSFNPLVRLPEFLMGMSLGALHARGLHWPKGVPALAWLVGAILLLAGLWHGAEGLWRTAFHNSLLSPLYCLVILGLANSDDLAARFLASRPMALLGEASYALYILHIPAMFYLGHLQRRILPDLSPAHLTIAFFAIAVPLSIAAHLWVETPLRRALRGRGPAGTGKAAGTSQERP